MATLDQREAATGRRARSDSKLPLTLQRRIQEDTTKAVVQRASEAFSQTLIKELEKIRVNADTGR